MNGGTVVSPRALYPQFGEAAGKVSGVDWLFGLDEMDPWVKTYVTIHRLPFARLFTSFPAAGERILTW